MTCFKNYIPACCLVFLLFSCHQPKEKNELPVPPETPVTIAPGEEHSNTLTTVMLHDDYLSGVTQTFVVKKNRVSVITGKKGLRVTVNPAALETSNGKPVTGDITIKMIELTNSDELFKSNAATMSNGQLLVSGGSYFVGMQSNGQELRLKGQHTIKMELPKLKEEDMELFYGNKDANGNMNWVKADEPLSFDYNSLANRNAARPAFNLPYPDNEIRKRFVSKFRMYKKLNDTIYFGDKLMTIEQLVKKLQANGVDKNIDTLLIPAHEFYSGLYYDKRYKEDTIKRYRIVSCKDIEDDIAYREAEKKITAERDEVNRRYYAAWRQKYDDGTLEDQITRYYAPSSVSKLGWINCDRFYENPEPVEMPVEMPYTFTNPDVQYFLIFKSVNGLMSGRLYKDKHDRYMLSGLPKGEPVTLVAFTKSKGQVYQCKKDFVIKPGIKLAPEFNPVSDAEMKNIFGANVKI